jgi:hypothetical protein
MRFSAFSETVAIVKDRERCCLLIASIVRLGRVIICKGLTVQAMTCGAADGACAPWDS